MKGIILDDLDPADPYSAVTMGIKRLIEWGFKESGSMCEDEYENLKKLEDFTNHLSLTP
jgi:hypothetical protein